MDVVAYVSIETSISIAIAYVLSISLQDLAKKTRNIIKISVISVILALLVGLLKEVIDVMQGQKLNWKDIVAEIGGCLLGFLIMMAGVIIRVILIRNSKKMKQNLSKNEENGDITDLM
ncbi:MAG: hypothetical protein EZS28_017804 [Streblomastix strix]|uniref:Uncharacterized protein n=1 Tax=Streblomastix strix TaxID=222440 RepID=A0A5J4VVJ1_9EUKA|nr:MAG: hypothetical protein EZS28_017804 [Streblomastix strix]